MWFKLFILCDNRDLDRDPICKETVTQHIFKIRLVFQTVTGQLADMPTCRQPTHGLVNSQLPSITVAANMSEITNTLNAFVGFGFQVGLLICLFIFSCWQCYKIPTESQ